MKHTLSVALSNAVERQFGLHVVAASQLTGGEESRAWRIETDEGPRVLMEYPSWRTQAEMAWVHRLTIEVAAAVPEAVAPLYARDGSTLARYRNRLVAVFPFVDGEPLDREETSQRAGAVYMLARLHRAFLACSPHGLRPPSGPGAPAGWTRPPDPPELVDSELDHLLGTLQTGARRLARAPIHGDYYRSNVLVRGGRIAGVIDWTEAHIDWLVQELAWSTWEFCHNAAGDDLLPDRAGAFLEEYVASGGPVPTADFDLIIPFIRVRLRNEIRMYHAATARGLSWDREYAEAETRAFQRLRCFPPLISWIT